MMNKKLAALAMVTVLGISMVGGTTVFASSTTPSSGASTSVSYVPGQSGGGDISDWVVDFPVKVNLDNDAKTAKTGADLEFKLFNADPDGPASVPYNKNHTVQVKLDQHEDAVDEDGSIKLKDSEQSDTAGVKMKVAKPDGSSGFVDVMASTAKPVEIGSMSKNNDSGGTGKESELTAKAYISNFGKGEKGKSYTTELTWTFTQTQ